MSNVLEIIRKVYLFSHLSEENINKLNQISTVREYDPNDILFYEGQEAENLYILLDGLVKAYKLTEKGTEITITQFKPISMIGEYANFEKIPYPATAQFITKGKALLVDSRAFERDFLSSPDILLSIIKSLTIKIKTLDTFIQMNMIMGAEARVAKLLIENPDIFKSFKHHQVASFLNITPETLSRIITKFKTKNLISMEKSNISVLNKEALRIISEL